MQPTLKNLKLVKDRIYIETRTWLHWFRGDTRDVPVGESSSAAYDNVHGWTECHESAWMHVATL